MNQFNNRQMIVLCVLSMGIGALLVPPMQGIAQPPQNSGTSETQSLETPQTLATPEPSESGRTTRAVGPITGQGTAGFISKFTAPNAIGNSVIFESAGKIGIGTTTPAGLLSVRGVAANINPIYALNTSTGNAIFGTSNGIGIYGQHTGTGGDQPGVYGETGSNSVNAAGVLGTMLQTAPGANSAGVRGTNRSTNANGFGVFGSHAGSGSGVSGDSVSGIGVRGRHTLNSGTAPGVSGETNSTAANATGVQGIINATNSGAGSTGVRGINNSTNANGYGVYGSHAGGGKAVYGSAANGYGIYGDAPSGYGVYGSSTNGYGVYGTAPSGYGVYGSSSTGYGVYGYSPSGNGVYGSSNSGNGVYGYSSSNNGVYGSSYSANGVYGRSTTNVAIYGISTNSYGVYGTSSYSRGISGQSLNDRGVYGYGYVGVEGEAKDTSSYAGNFKGQVYVKGNLTVTGTLYKGAGSFKIDHPQRPSTEYLSHSFVESPDMMNVYNGNAITNSKGEAWVKMPSYFQSLNRDFRYQLTPIGQFAQAIVGREIQGNRFLIRTDKPGVKVSWQVTGIRNDAYARQHRIRVEENKVGGDRGKYLYPAGFGAGDDKQIGYPASRLAKR